MAQKTNLKHERARMRYSQAQLAALAGISKTTLVEAEGGETINLTSAYGILEALNLLRARYKEAPLRLEDVEWNIRDAD